MAVDCAKIAGMITNGFIFTLLGCFENEKENACTAHMSSIRKRVDHLCVIVKSAGVGMTEGKYDWKFIEYIYRILFSSSRCLTS